MACPLEESGRGAECQPAERALSKAHSHARHWGKKETGPRTRQINCEGWRMLASLEHLPVAVRTVLWRGVDGQDQEGTYE